MDKKYGRVFTEDDVKMIVAAAIKADDPSTVDLDPIISQLSGYGFELRFQDGEPIFVVRDYGSRIEADHDAGRRARSALAGVVEAEPETPEQTAARERFLRGCEGKFAEVYNPRPANELFGEAEPAPAFDPPRITGHDTHEWVPPGS